jgi:hypothetical protein
MPGGGAAMLGSSAPSSPQPAANDPVIPVGVVINGLDEGIPSGDRLVAEFVDPDGALPTVFYSADIGWGDGTVSSTGTILNPGNGLFTVTGSHTYTEEGAHIVLTITIHKFGAPDAATFSEAIVQDLSVVPAAGTTLTLPEANSTQSVTLATFTDPGGSEALVDYSADVDWGDGTTTTATITFDASTGIFSVTGTHAFADEGTFSVTTTIHHDMAPDVTVTDVLTSTESDVLGAGPSQPVLSVPEGGTLTGAVATFTDTNTSNIPGDFTASIDWGDGTTTTGTVTGASGLFTVSGSHKYTEEGVQNLKITLTDDAPGTATFTVSNVALVTEVPVAPVGGLTLTAVEGTASTSQPVATFTDPAGAEALANYSADIDWGDGTSATGTITFDATSGTFSVSGSHNYADEDIFSLTVTIHHETADAAVVHSTANVSEADILAAAANQPNPTAVQGMSFSGSVAVITDTGYPANIAGDFTASIDWGDGNTTTGTVSGGSGLFTVSGTHTYTGAGQFTISTTMSEDGGATATAKVTVTVQINVENSTPVVTGGFTFAATEGLASSDQTVATFTDPGGDTNVQDFSADIDWGDGTSATGTITLDASTGVFTVKGSHTFAEEGTDNISGTIHHQMASAAPVNSTADVADANLTAQGTSLTTEEGVAVNGTVVTFTDANPGGTLSDFTASIDWGDGTTTPGTVAGSGGDFSVTGSHTYAEDGNFTASVTVHDVGGKNASAMTRVIVTEPALVGSSVSAMFFEVSSATTMVASFTHGQGNEPASDFTATINWGDGTSSSGTVTLVNGVYQVTGSHAYGDENRDVLPLVVTVTDSKASGETLVQESSININSSATVVETLLPDGTRGTANQRFLSEVYNDLLQRAIDPNGLASWGALLNHGVDRATVVLDIEHTTEYRTDEVNGLYLRYLNRVADPTGLDNALTFLAAGGTVEQVAEGIILSKEYAATAGPTFATFLNKVYEQTFNRPVDAKGLSDAEAVLAAGGTVQSIVDNIFSSDEYIDDLVRSYYNTLMPQKLLDRDVEFTPGFIAWTNFLKQSQFFPNHTDENAIAEIMSFVEYFSKTEP